MKIITCSIGSIMLSFFLVANCVGQQEITLEDAIDIALEKSLEIRGAFLDASMADINLKQSKHARLPSLNASGTYGYSFGRTIDPTSNDFVTTNIGYNSWGMNASIILFSGGRIHQTVQQAQLNLRSSDATLEQIKRDVALNVSLAYLNVISAEDQFANARNQVVISASQLDRLQTLIDAGNQPANAIVELQAQLLTNEQRVIQAESQVDIAYLNLAQWLRKEGQEIKVVRPQINTDIWYVEKIPPLEEIMAAAMTTQMNLTADSFAIEAAEKGVSIAQSSYYPTISLGGSLSTNFSTQGREIIGSTTNLNSIPVRLNGMETILELPSEVPIYEKSSYASQLNSNFGYSFGINLNVPIYNNYRNKAQVANAKINVKRAQLAYERDLLSLRQNVSNARAEAKAALKYYEAAKKTREAQKIAYDNLFKSMEIGSANNFDLINAKTRLEDAIISEINAKYDALFKLKIIDYYMGKRIELQ